MINNTQFKYFILSRDISWLKKSIPACYDSNVEILANTDINEFAPGYYYNSINSKIHLPQDKNYSYFAYLYWVWKNCSSDYIYISLDENYFFPTEDEIISFIESNDDILLQEPCFLPTPIQEHYRSLYYDEDYRAMLYSLELFYSEDAKFAVGSYNTTAKMYSFSAVIKKEVLNDFCSWVFPVINNCISLIKPKYSKFQNQYTSHITCFLFNLYLNKTKNLKINTLKDVPAIKKPPVELLLPTTEEELYSLFEKLYNSREVECAISLVRKYESKAQTSINKLSAFCDRYERERRFKKQTFIDVGYSLDSVLANVNVPTIKRKEKALIFKWASVTNDEAVASLKLLGIECEEVEINFNDWSYDEYLLMTIKKKFENNSYAFVFSVNYFAMVSEACYLYNVPYIAWCYDSPTFIGDPRYLSHPTTTVYMFDSREANKFRAQGHNNVYYFPLATNIDRLDKIIPTSADHQKYDCDASFVGQLYNTEFNSSLSSLTDYQKGYINALVDYQQSSYTHDYLAEFLTEDFMDFLHNPEFTKAINAEWDKRDISDETAIPARLKILLEKLATYKDRLLLITLLSRHCHFKLFSTNTNELFSKVDFCGIIEYYNEMPKLFKCSKLNLNISFRAIKSGIPQRCIDIMACGGALLTNFQPDMEGYITDGKEAIIYTSHQEAYEKAMYYLKHDSELKKIANNGYLFAKENFNYKKALSEMIKNAGLNYLLNK